MSESDASAAVKFKNVTKVYNPGSQTPFTALRDVSLNIERNEFFTLLGPSGCGKTTLLRILAGFEATTSGELEVFGESVAHLPPNKRSINTVFQHYALFPHLTVRENIAFGLQRLGKPKSKQTQIVDDMLALVHMEAYGERKPEQLSGGQKQRVALARALAPRPRVLLLDEPLSALDLKLRQSMRWELKALQKKTGVTFVFVTHDQEEALAMSNRIAVISRGQVQQIGTPDAIYEAPANRFVADFIGESNLINATLIDKDKESCTFTIGKYKIHCNFDTIPDSPANSEVTLSVRPERILLSPLQTTDTQTKVPGQIDSNIYLGNAREFRIMIDEQSIVARAPQGGLRGNWNFAPGETVGVNFEPGAVQVLAE